MNSFIFASLARTETSDAQIKEFGFETYQAQPNTLFYVLVLLAILFFLSVVILFASSWIMSRIREWLGTDEE